jgi:hypothetical protein
MSIVNIDSDYAQRAAPICTNCCQMNQIVKPNIHGQFEAKIAETARQ